jgi:hypothetical protein
MAVIRLIHFPPKGDEVVVGLHLFQELAPQCFIIYGSRSQIARLTRRGDYSAMSVVPVDGCTFRYPNEYLKATESFNWNT